MISGVADKLESICRYQSVEDVKIAAAIKSNCSLTNIKYKWAIYWYYDSSEEWLSLELLDNTLPTLHIQKDDLQAEYGSQATKGIYKVDLGVSVNLGRILIRQSLRHFVGSFPSEKNPDPFPATGGQVYEARVKSREKKYVELEQNSAEPSCSVPEVTCINPIIQSSNENDKDT
ncbi:unnamed protein product [Mytilus coruscus]|uniref:Uncharacterized protein n=1 Tax=Mytilus coruscus TaxID=42192 RepID=A0A6J8DWW0_MYTCO|nr:unnamed protein product [Mytilus coruscus]